MIDRLKHWLASGILTSFLIIAGQPAEAQSCGDAELLMNEVGVAVVEILNQEDLSQTQREVELGKLLARSFDLHYIARLIIGPTYKSLTATQREDYHELFSAFVLKSYSARLSSYSGQTFRVESSASTGKKDTLVTSILQRAGGSPFKVDWRLRCRGDELRVIDVVVEGVSMVIAQRNEFTSTLAAKGFDGLLAILRSRIERAGATQPA